MTMFNTPGIHWLEMLGNSPSLVKLLAFFFVWTVVWFPILIPLARLINWHPVKPLTGNQKLPLLASLYLIAPLIVWGATRVERCSLADYGLFLNWKIFLSLFLGLTLSVGGIILLFTAQYLLGWVQWQGVNMHRLWLNFIPLFAVGIGVGFTEELVFRGFLLSELTQDYTFWISATISSIIFAVLHLIWEQKETIPQLPGLWLMGMVLSAAKLIDGGGLGLAIGLHSGWIFALSSLMTAELIVFSDNISPWITGFNQQPLAGIAGVLFLLFTAAVLWVL